MGLNSTQLVVLKATNTKIHLKNSMTMSLDRNHDLVSQDNPKTLLWAVSNRTYFISVSQPIIEEWMLLPSATRLADIVQEKENSSHMKLLMARSVRRHCCFSMFFFSFFWLSDIKFHYIWQASLQTDISNTPKQSRWMNSEMGKKVFSILGRAFPFATKLFSHRRI